MKKLAKYPVFINPVVFWSLSDLFQNDEVLADKMLDKYTVNPEYQRSTENPDSEYELFSDRNVRLWPNY